MNSKNDFQQEKVNQKTVYTTNSRNKREEKRPFTHLLKKKFWKFLLYRSSIVLDIGDTTKDKIDKFLAYTMLKT